MEYLELLNTELAKPSKNGVKKYKVLDLFAGCGGLALGFEAAGFQTVGYEMLTDPCWTYSTNLIGMCHELFLQPSQELTDEADVVVGGPPCQPFSVGGLQAGKNDRRDGFQAFLSAVERYNPQLVMFENVRGMLYKNKSYFSEIVSLIQALGYVVEWRLLKSVHYGVPQLRERLFVVGHRGQWKFPKSYSKASYTVGEALGALAYEVTPETKFLTKSMDDYVARYEEKSKCIRPRDLHLDQPSRTVTCRNLAGATADMLRIRLPDGRRKRVTVREGARLQSFPDWFEFYGSEGSKFNQIGNAVPPLLAKALATSVLAYLDSPTRLSWEEIKERNSVGQLSLAIDDRHEPSTS